MAFNKLNVVIGANIEALQKELRKVEKDLQRFGRNMQRIGTDLTQLISVPIAGLGAASLKSFADIERLEKGLISLMGSTEAAQAEMVKLREVAKLPGLGFQEAIDGSVRLQAVGFSADKARETLLAFGKAVAVSGGTREDFGEVIYQLTQMTSKGEILAEDFKVLQSRIPILGQLLQDAFGTRSIEAIRDSGVGAAEFTQAIIDAANKSEILKNVTGGLGNAFENFKDSAKIALSELGKEINRVLDVQGFLERLAKGLSEGVTAFNNFSDGTKKFIIVAAGIAATLGPALLIIGKIASVAQLAVVGFSSLVGGVKNLIAFFALLPGRLAAARTAILVFTGSLTAMQAVLVSSGIGLALLAIAAAYTAIKKAATEATAAQKAIADVQSQAIQQTAQEVGQVKQLVRVIQDENTSKKGRIDAINKLKQISPEYFGALDSEKAKTTDLITISNKYTESLINRAKAQLAASKIAEIDAQLADTQLTTQEAQLSFFQKARNLLLSGGNAALAGGLDVASFTKNLKTNQEALKQQRAELEKTLKLAAAGSGVQVSGVGGLPSATPKKKRGALIGQIQALESGAARVSSIGGGLYSDQTIALTKKYSDVVGGLTTQYSFLTSAQESLNLKVSESLFTNPAAIESASENLEIFKTQVQGIGLAFDALGERAMPSVNSAIQEGLTAFAEYAKSGIKSMKDLGRAVLAAGAVIIKSFIQQGVAAAVANAFKNPAGIIPPLGLALAAAAGAAASGLFSGLISKIGVPALAGGGIASGATLALVGEYPGAKTNPEVIAPLDKLKRIIGDSGGGSNGFIAQTFISGSDLRVVLSRADRTFTRTTTG